mgnify:FL=1
MSTGIVILRNTTLQKMFSLGIIFSSLYILFRGINLLIKLIPYFLDMMNAINEPIVHPIMLRIAAIGGFHKFEATGIRGRALTGAMTLAIIDIIT